MLEMGEKGSVLRRAVVVRFGPGRSCYALVGEVAWHTARHEGAGKGRKQIDSPDS